MIIEILEDDLALCIVALEYAAKELREGCEAGDRLGAPLSASIPIMASNMDDLKNRLLAFGQERIKDGY